MLIKASAEQATVGWVFVPAAHATPMSRLGIAIATYRRLERLQRLVERVQALTTLPYELVIADDGSGDGTAEWAAASGLRVVTGRNHGVSWNKNRGLYALSTTDCEPMLVLEDDVLPSVSGWERGWIEGTARWHHLAFAHPKIADDILQGEGTPESPFVNNKATAQCVSISGEALRKVGFFDARFKGYGVEHAEWTTRIKRAGYGFKEVELPDGRRAKANLYITGGLEADDAPSFREKAQVQANSELFRAIRHESIYREPWSTLAERTEFLREQADSGLSRRTTSSKLAVRRWRSRQGRKVDEESLSVCMLLHRSVEHDGRVRREVRALKGTGHETLVLHLPTDDRLPDGPLDGGQLVSVAPRSGLGRALPPVIRRGVAAARFVLELGRADPDVVHAHDAAMLLPAALGARLTRASLVYDSHELATGVPYRERSWSLLVRAIERLLVPRCDAVLTVSDGISEHLQERYALSHPPEVVRNVPDRELVDSAPASHDLRATFGIGDGALILHQGSAAPGRGRETLLQALALLPNRCHLVFLGVDPDSPDSSAISELAAARGVPERVHMLPPVPLSELLAHTAQADVGVSLLEDSCENHRLALPNKVFEYLAAGLPIVISALPELQRLLDEYPSGRAADPFDPAAVALALEDVLNRPRAEWPGLERAREELSWASEQTHLADLYARVGEARRSVAAPSLEATSSTGTPARRRLSRTLSRARWSEYEDLISTALDRGYSIRSLDEWLESDGHGRVLLLRHDVDQHPASALRMARIEHEANVRSTWYFRWRTAEPRVIDEIRNLGGTVGLHYETLTRMVMAGEVDHPADPATLDRARNILKQEIAAFQRLFGPTTSIAAHGDSRVPKVRNSDVVQGVNASDLGIAFDGNEAMKGRGLAVWLTDRSTPEGRWVDGMDPNHLFEEGRSPILCLTHPNNWVSGPGLWADRIASAILPAPRRDRRNRLVRTGRDMPPAQLGLPGEPS